MHLTVAFLSVSLLSVAAGHGLMCDPYIRGYLGKPTMCGMPPFDPNAPTDFFAHFPSGDKSRRPLAGVQSQKHAAGYNWVPFKPLIPGFRWRAGICGDKKYGPHDHMKGGKYYYGGRITRTYTQGGFLNMKVGIVAHHNGFIQAHVCDMKKCPNGEISEKCFPYACKELMYAPESRCQSGYDKSCAPKDSRNPGRAYLPCSKYPVSGRTGPPEIYHMRFKLPDNVACDHCVLHWFWTSANNCNPPGVKEFYEGPDRPKWPRCHGQAGAIGGYARNQGLCGGPKFPEEYYQCADIAIRPRGQRSIPRPQGPPATQPPPPAPKPPAPAGNSGSLAYVQFIADGQVRGVIRANTGYLAVNVGYRSKFTFKAVIASGRRVNSVRFYLNGKMVRKESSPPYHMFGDAGSRPYPWGSPILNRDFRIVVETDGGRIQCTVKIVK